MQADFKRTHRLSLDKWVSIMAKNGIYFTEEEMQMLLHSMEKSGLGYNSQTRMINYLDLFRHLSIELTQEQLSMLIIDFQSFRRSSTHLDIFSNEALSSNRQDCKS